MFAAEVYHQYMVPFLFQVYADDLAGRIDVPANGAVLETAAGTGVLTRSLRDRLPTSTRLVSTDINDAMLDVAREIDGVEFQVADATDLPFDDNTFDAVFCQFGVMFYPDKERGFSEVARVLKPGGRYLFNVWDRIERNEIPNAIHEFVTAKSPDDPPGFLTVPIGGFADMNLVTTMLQAAGFRDIDIAVLPRQTGPASVKDIITGQVRSTPLLGELKARDLGDDQTLSEIEGMLRDKFGPDPISAPLQAIAFVAHR